ncbi:MAG: hypothetical protein EAZ15_03515 [Sphingobacteriales bacterium]|nr:MAG: hypothetical protein EAZ15_03515 [Sphingobacteriales bacterium]
MKYSKLPITIESQIIKFKSRGLKFSNDIDAAITLSNINYYRLRAYTYPFQNNLDIKQPFKCYLAHIKEMGFPNNWLNEQLWDVI